MEETLKCITSVEQKLTDNSPLLLVPGEQSSTLQVLALQLDWSNTGGLLLFSESENTALISIMGDKINKAAAVWWYFLLITNMVYFIKNIKWRSTAVHVGIALIAPTVLLSQSDKIGDEIQLWT